MDKKNGNAANKPLIRLLFLLYVVLMVWLLFVQRIDAGGTAVEENWNFHPFKTLRLYYGLMSSENSYYIVHAFVNLVGNVLMFVPLGFFLPSIWNVFRRFWVLAPVALFLVVTVEAMQYFTGLGSCDVDDLILNLPGVICGYLLYRSVRKNRR